MTVALRQWISRSGDIDRWVTFCLFAAYLTWPIYIFQIAQIGTFPVIVSMVFMVLAVAVWMLRFLIGRQTVAWHASTLWVIAICTAALLSETTLIMQGAPSSHSVLSLIHLCFYALAVIVWSSESHAADLFIKVLRIQILFAVVICLFGIYQIFARLYKLPLAWLEISNIVYSSNDQLSLRFANFFRATSIFSEPSGLGLFCVHNLLIMGVAAYAKQGARLIHSGFLRKLAAAIFIVTLFLTYSLSGILTGVIILGCMVLLLEGKRKWSVFRYTLIGLAIAVSLDLMILKPIFDISVTQLAYERIVLLVQGQKTGIMMPGESYEKRLNSVITGVRIWEQYPIFGAGLGRYGEVSGTSYEKFSDTFYSGALAEIGLVGTMVIVLAMVSLIVALRRAARHYERHSSEWLALQVCAFLIMYVAITGWAYSFLFSEVFWLNIGAALVFLKTLSPAGKVISLASLRGRSWFGKAGSMERPVFYVQRIQHN